jgi:hypothetical protein
MIELSHKTKIIKIIEIIEIYEPKDEIIFHLEKAFG